jgi:hypothetical protein
MCFNHFKSSICFGREVGNISLDNAFSRFEVPTAVLMIEVCGILNRVDWQIATDIAGALVTPNCKVQQSEMEAAPPSVTIYQLTQCNIPQDFFTRLLKPRVILLNLVADKTI